MALFQSAWRGLFSCPRPSAFWWVLGVCIVARCTVGRIAHQVSCLIAKNKDGSRIGCSHGVILWVWLRPPYLAAWRGDRERTHVVTLPRAFWLTKNARLPASFGFGGEGACAHAFSLTAKDRALWHRQQEANQSSPKGFTGYFLNPDLFQLIARGSRLQLPARLPTVSTTTLLCDASRPAPKFSSLAQFNQSTAMSTPSVLGSHQLGAANAT